MGAEREGLPQLIRGLGRSQGQHRHGAAEPLGDLDGLLHRAFLVRADREPGHPGVHLLAVRGDHDAAADLGNPFHAHGDLHRRQLRIRALSGSNRGVAPATATVTG